MSNDKVKGTAKRLIEVPGYHLHPRYDLVHTRHLVHQRRHQKKSFHLNLAPMVDMFSILVIYLLMNFSSTGEVFFIAKDIKIPQVSKGVPMQSYPLVSVVGDKVMFDALDPDGKSVYVEELNDGKSEKLRVMLKQMKRMEEQIGGSQTFRGQINIQADEGMQVEQVKKVMQVLIDEGWNTINFIVEPNAELSVVQ